MTHTQVVEELPIVEELEALDNIVGASFLSDGIATPFLAMVPVASATILVSCEVVVLVRVWWGGGKRKQISDLGLKTKEARREGGRMLRYREANRPRFVNTFCF